MIRNEEMINFNDLDAVEEKFDVGISDGQLVD